MEGLEKAPTSVHRSNTAPIRQQRSKKTSPDSSANPITTTAETDRPASEKRPSAHQTSTEPRRKSIASSEDSTTKSRRRGHGSLPSSRRTSCTIVDPSRPARHYRIKSSQTCPTLNREIDDVLALHFRSCSLFSNPAYSSNLPSPTISGYRGANTDFGSMRVDPPPPAPQASQDGIESLSPKESEEAVATPEVANTLHWISPSTRKMQYEKIDRANSGLRGFAKRIVPRCVSGHQPQRFYEKDRSDVGSVRRYRMDVSDDEEVDEKSALRLQSRKVERSRPEQKNDNAKRKKWGCF
ncbi:hypothetical protein BU26DRAFT_434418 [Trematosphaeria pertusa]|uniref:Uncharacterized protein n=1 Tax=Trematosphaeria pertusa TaxID=390896 RepID=A0A6A6I3A2_9PLEO|nr:uncharacterized protein BU26DRAFT_434418 [Trematosphaeria pertusa]KAF2244639.1 hypothetical protein BU26DRAFT_434418 [Trematosphaeria pertusa]